MFQVAHIEKWDVYHLCRMSDEMEGLGRVISHLESIEEVRALRRWVASSHLSQVRQGISEDLLGGLDIHPLESAKLRTGACFFPGEILR